jgi:hypothetical protein
MTIHSLAKKCAPIILTLAVLQPQAANAFSNSDISEALTYSGCTFGLVLEPNQFGWEQTLRSNVGMGLQFRLIDEGLSVPGIEKIDTPEVRIGYNHLLQSWTTAGVLSSKWKSLETTYEKGLQAGIKKWNSGASLGISKNSARAIAVPKLTALCRVAEVGVKTKASKAKLTMRNYVIKVARGYLPPLR